MTRRLEGESDGFLLITPTACRHHARNEGQTLDTTRFRKWYKKEFGYAPPPPAHFASEIKTARRINFGSLADNNQILTACQESLEPNLRRYWSEFLSPNDNPNSFFELANYRFKIVNESPLRPAEAALRDYWLAWRQIGEYEDERRLEVGLTYCQLTLYTSQRLCHMIWWERETHVTNQKTLRQIFDQQCRLLDGLGSRDIPQLLAEVVRGWMSALFSHFGEIYRRARDCSAHLYQNPMWERFWFEVGKEGMSAAIQKSNRHPESGRERGDHRRHIVADPYRTDQRKEPARTRH